MDIEMRNLQASDLFTMAKILKGIGLTKIREAVDMNGLLEKAMTKTTDDKSSIDVSQVGMDVVFALVGVVLENLPNIEMDLYKFIGSLVDMKPADVAKLDPNTFLDLMIGIFKKEEFSDFFKRAAKFMRME